MKFEFQFYWSDPVNDNEIEVTKVLEINTDIETLNDFIGSEDFEDTLEYLETEYGVHDITTPENDFDEDWAYTSYEVEPNRFDDLMNEWEAIFKGQGWM